MCINVREYGRGRESNGKGMNGKEDGNKQQRKETRFETEYTTPHFPFLAHLHPRLITVLNFTLCDFECGSAPLAGLASQTLDGLGRSGEGFGNCAPRDSSTQGEINRTTGRRRAAPRDADK